MAAAGWGDAATVVPWVMYQRTGDRGILATQFESMRSWVDHISALAGESRLWDTGFQFGDWLDPAAPPDRPSQGSVPSLVATAYSAHSARLTNERSRGLGIREEQARYQRLADEVRVAFAGAYVIDDGRLTSDSQTAYALALEFDLLPDAYHRSLAGERLAELVQADGYRIGTGFLGTPLICDALCHAENATRPTGGCWSGDARRGSTR